MTDECVYSFVIEVDLKRGNEARKKGWGGVGGTLFKLGAAQTRGDSARVAEIATGNRERCPHDGWAPGA